MERERQGFPLGLNLFFSCYKVNRGQYIPRNLKVGMNHFLSSFCYKLCEEEVGGDGADDASHLRLRVRHRDILYDDSTTAPAMERKSNKTLAAPFFFLTIFCHGKSAESSRQQPRFVKVIQKERADYHTHHHFHTRDRHRNTPLQPPPN